jgi:hypothetical protein
LVEDGSYDHVDFCLSRATEGVVDAVEWLKGWLREFSGGGRCVYTRDRMHSMFDDTPLDSSTESEP